MSRILICDDEPDIVNALKIYLEAEEYQVTTAGNGLEALQAFQREKIDLVLLDIMMPGMDGITTMAKLREISNVPVILLTAKSEDSDKILGLNVGADDYITKPFNPAEVIARVRSQLRRYLRLGSRSPQQTQIQFGGFELDDESKTLRLDEEIVPLTPTEYAIMKLFLQNPGKVFSPDDIYRTVWRETPMDSKNTIAVHIRHLRKKIEFDADSPRYLQVVWGQGYRLSDGRFDPKP